MDVRGEVRKVAWPTRDQTVHNASVVLLLLTVLVVAFALLDGTIGRAVTSFMR